MEEVVCVEDSPCKCVRNEGRIASARNSGLWDEHDEGQDVS